MYESKYICAQKWVKPSLVSEIWCLHCFWTHRLTHSQTHSRTDTPEYRMPPVPFNDGGGMDSSHFCWPSYYIKECCTNVRQNSTALTFLC